MSSPRLLSGLLGLGGLALLGCTETEVVRELRSLQGSEDAVFVCRDANGNGHPFEECPDRDASDDENEGRDLAIFALVSQTVTDEVAVVNVTGGHVVDIDPSTPGFGFLRVGGRPVSMAASPGGAASFVATAELGRTGIFGLPTTCLEAPEPRDIDGPFAEPSVRDLTTWPACRLDSAPGEVSVLVERPEGDTIFSSCQGAPRPEQPSDTRPRGGDPSKTACPADLQGEGGPTGRRKLVVSLPDRGELVTIDAQWLLDQAPGEFPDCEIEGRLPLDVDVPPDIAQVLPPDLETTCTELPPPMAPPPSRRAPQPAGFAVADSRLYVADQAAPVIHVVDTSNLCDLAELPALLPMSLREPERVVTTRRVAVSPVTPSGKQFVYAIDAEDQPGASVMAFDVSEGVTDRTPIVRPGSPELPGERPDRLALGSSAKDVTFAYRDLPYADPATGVGTFGTLCDPNPEVSKDTPAALARPSDDFSFGARPGLLRGLFGFVLLSNGTIAVVDVEDFDAPCRRPIQANPSATPDIRGCANDSANVSFFTEDGSDESQSRTVTGEVSCLVVEPHRFRALYPAVNDSGVGVHAPSLRGFPQLTLPASVASGTVEDRPRLLGVAFDDEPAEVWVGSTRHSTAQDSDDPLPIDPNSRVSEQAQSLNAVVLPPLQPRAYASEDTATLTYEGSYAGDRTAGFLSDTSLEDAELVLSDSSLSFCNAGVYDEATMAAYAEADLGLSPEDAALFGQEHADYVQLTTALPDSRDAYWKRNGTVEYAECLEAFLPHDAETLAEARDFRIVRAFADRLLLVHRGEAPKAPAAACFPTANKYRLRVGSHWVLLHAATGFNHDIVATGDERACTRSCSPLKKWAKSRAFEISSERPNCVELDDDGNLPEGEPLDQRVGCARDGEVACVYDQGEPGSGAFVKPGSDGSECIFNGLTERFALYRGRLPSARDAVFAWQTTGGFSPLLMSLANVSLTVSPQSMQFLQQPELMAVVDGAGLGLSLLSLDTFVVTKPSPFY